jgi:divinyl protochlorophyllide a 8-vinyl-reductase
MIQHSTTALRRPNRGGFMAPYILLETAAAIEDVIGADNLELALKEAQLFRLPSASEPVREDKVARLHQAVRKLWARQATDIFKVAGQGAAKRVIETQISERAQVMLAKTARQNAWIFSGSGDFVVESESRFQLRANPVVQGEVPDGHVCHFHVSLLQELFSTLIHPRLKCREVRCHAAGADACTFEFTMAAA